MPSELCRVACRCKRRLPSQTVRRGRCVYSSGGSLAAPAVPFGLCLNPAREVRQEVDACSYFSRPSCRWHQTADLVLSHRVIQCAWNPLAHRAMTRSLMQDLERDLATIDIKAPRKSSPSEDSAPETRRLTAVEIFQAASENARDELRRSNQKLAFSGVAGGLTMGLTGLGVASMRALLGHEGQHIAPYLLYPIGFIAVIIGRANFSRKTPCTRWSWCWTSAATWSRHCAYGESFSRRMFSELCCLPC